ncbi:unnamed protein product [Sphagnum balticum]
MATSSQFGSFVETNFTWEIQQIQTVEPGSPEFKELLVRLYQNIGKIALTLNIKDTGQYPTSEFVTGKQFFPNPANNSSTAANPALRQVLRKVINYTKPLEDTATATIPHGIVCTAATTFTLIMATATDPVGKNYIPIPYASAAGGNQIELRVDATNVYIITASNRNAFTQTYIVLEYLQS